MSGLLASMLRAKIENSSFALSCDSGIPTLLLITQIRCSMSRTCWIT